MNFSTRFHVRGHFSISELSQTYTIESQSSESDFPIFRLIRLCIIRTSFIQYRLFSDTRATLNGCAINYVSICICHVCVRILYLHNLNSKLKAFNSHHSARLSRNPRISKCNLTVYFYIYMYICYG